MIIDDIVLVFVPNIDLGHYLELSPQAGSNEYPASMVLYQNKEINVNRFKHRFSTYKEEFVKSLYTKLLRDVHPATLSRQEK